MRMTTWLPTPTSTMAQAANRGADLLQRYQTLDNLRIVLFLQAMNSPVVLVHFARIIHRAELRTTHGAECRFLVVVIRQSLVVHGTRRLGIKRQGKLFLPIKLVAREAEGIIPILSAWSVARDVS